MPACAGLTARNAPCTTPPAPQLPQVWRWVLPWYRRRRQHGARYANRPGLAQAGHPGRTAAPAAASAPLSACPQHTAPALPPPLCAGAGKGYALNVPLRDGITGGWRGALGCWGLVARWEPRRTPRRTLVLGACCCWHTLTHTHSHHHTDPERSPFLPYPALSCSCAQTRPTTFCSSLSWPKSWKCTAPKQWYCSAVRGTPPRGAPPPCLGTSGAAPATPLSPTHAASQHTPATPATPPVPCPRRRGCNMVFLTV